MVVDLNDNPHGARVKGPNWALISPSPERITVCHGWTPEEVWAGTPDFPNSLDAAWVLPIPKSAKQLKGGLAIWSREGEWVANYAGALVFGDMAAQTTNPAFSVCCSWLAYETLDDLTRPMD